MGGIAGWQKQKPDEIVSSGRSICARRAISRSSRPGTRSCCGSCPVCRAAVPWFPPARAGSAPCAEPTRGSVRPSGSRSSSFRVPLLLMSMAGNTRLSTSFRSRWISMLPVPLNSSKITSSMRLPVSISAEAMMVSEPPSSMLRAAPKKRFGRCSALESTPPESTLPEGGHHGVVSARQTRDRVQQNHDVSLVLHQPLGLLDHHFGHLHVARGGLIEGGTDHFALHRTLHVGDFFRTFVDEQHDQSDFGMIRRDASWRCSAAASSFRYGAGRRSGRAVPCRSESADP